MMARIVLTIVAIVAIVLGGLALRPLAAATLNRP